MTGSEILLAGFVALGLAALAAIAVRERRTAFRQRRGLLDAAAGEVAGSAIRPGPDGFPTLSGRLPDGRAIDLELVVDTLQFRRLPQLWLKVTIRETEPRPWPRIGALARPTGTEFYAVTPSFPARVLPPAGVAEGLLIRGDGTAGPDGIGRNCRAFTALFQDGGLKEAAIMPRGVRIVRQVAEGDRGAHLLLRQARFAPPAVAPDLLRRAIADAALLRDAQVGCGVSYAHSGRESA